MTEPPQMDRPLLAQARLDFHAQLLASLLTLNEEGVPSNADGSNPYSVEIARGITKRIGQHTVAARMVAQSSGTKFESICTNYIQKSFLPLAHVRPGSWIVEKGQTRGGRGIARFDQYIHLDELEALAKANVQLAAALGNDYLIRPDVMIYRFPETDDFFNAHGPVVSGAEAKHTGLRKVNSETPILHASISCKWTVRSDRVQNARSEGLNLVRNRKGRLPHIAVILGEPLPSRIASIALGTGDIDQVYHFALYELIDTVKELGYGDAAELLHVMIQGKRLRDISDLPIDLVV